MTANEFVSRMGAAARPRQTPAGWQCRCPAHEDGKASLSVGEQGDKVLLHCHAGCTSEAVCAAAGVKMAELFNGEKPHRNGHAQKPRIVATYDYTDEAGTPLSQVVRFDPKDFRQRRPDTLSRDGWAWSVNGVRPVPYRLPEIIKAVAECRPVFVVEGEKDADALVRLGFAATCNAGGAGKWSPDFGPFFKGAQVIIIPDRDEPGRKHAQDVGGKLSGHATTIRVSPGQGRWCRRLGYSCVSCATAAL